MLHQIETFFCVTGRLCGNSPVTGEFPAKASDTELWCFLICVWKNGRVNNREASDLRRHRAHYDVTVMELIDGMADGKWGISSLMCTRTWWTAFSKLNHSTTITLLIPYYATELIPQMLCKCFHIANGYVSFTSSRPICQYHIKKTQYPKHLSLWA